ncbi:hypothetical protein [Dokdonella sp.]|uniref:hypothetical protein n=1 Tax=Dokdonella sp. TaxID=2291710 RepID=UPI001B03EB62|nr:hypothetical protein [Dokdonella sp.]MBO9663636.1 hypothetical protein [Dokdonella sp.]
MHAIKPAPACACLLAFMLLAGASAPASAATAGSGIALAVTVGTDLSPNACGGATSLEVVFGDEVNFCYRVTNRTAAALDYQALSDDVDGVLLAPGTPHSLAPGDTWQYNRVARVLAGGLRTATWTAQAQAPGYTAQRRAGAFVDVSANPTAIPLDDRIFVGSQYGALDFTLPFPFTFYGIRTDRLCIAPNGVVGVAQQDCRFPYDNNAVGSPPAARAGMALMPLWDDFVPWPDGHSCGGPCRFIFGALYADTLGTAPNRKFVLQWHKRIHAPITMNADNASFEIVFDEASGGFSFEYGDVDYTAYFDPNGDPEICDGGACATVGVQAGEQNATVFSYLQASLDGGSGIDWNANAAEVARAGVNLTVGRPKLDAAAAATFFVAPGARRSATLRIANPGDHALDWTLGAPDPAAGAPVSAFGVRSGFIDISANDFLRIDVPASGPATAIATIDGGYGGGAFVDGDFSKEYVTRGWRTAPDGSTVSTRGFLETIDTATGAIAVVGDTGVSNAYAQLDSIYATAWDVWSNTLYALVQHSVPYLSATYLVSLDRYTGAATWLGELTFDETALAFGANGIPEFAIDDDGRLFGIATNENNEGLLLTIDPVTFATHTIGLLGTDAPFILPTGGLAFDPRDGRLYLNGMNVNDATTWLFSVDTTTGASTGIASIADPIGVTAFSFTGARGPCVQPEQVPWLAPTTTAGTLAAGGDGEIALALDASELAAGSYDTTLCLRSNDPYRHLLPLRVRLEVDADSIFQDGFDGASAP